MHWRVPALLLVTMLLAACGGDSSSGGSVDTSDVSGFYYGQYELAIERAGDPPGSEIERGRFGAHVLATARLVLILGHRLRLEEDRVVATDGSFGFGVPSEVFTKDSSCKGQIIVYGQADGETFSGGYRGTEILCGGRHTEVHGHFAGAPDPELEGTTGVGVPQ